jgi:hypothetical protein
MENISNKHLKEALEMSRKLTILADEGEASSTDDGCAVLYGIVRDCAYKIRGRAERERDVHKVLGIWDEIKTSEGREVSNAAMIQP